MSLETANKNSFHQLNVICIGKIAFGASVALRMTQPFHKFHKNLTGVIVL